MKAECPECSASIILEEYPQSGQVMLCRNCGAQSEIEPHLRSDYSFEYSDERFQRDILDFESRP